MVRGRDLARPLRDDLFRRPGDRAAERIELPDTIDPELVEAQDDGAVEIPQELLDALRPRLPADRDPTAALIATSDQAELRAQIRAMMKGALVAWDPVAGRRVWSVPMPLPWNGGVLSTAGGLVFQGNGTGEFAAYAADSGKQVLAVVEIKARFD